jgi:hypothetical protein
MLDRWSDGESLVDWLIAQFKNFLQQEDTEIFEMNRLKYLTYLDNFKLSVDKIPTISERKKTEVNWILLELYEIPKKRNNLFSVLLIFFFLVNHKKSKGKIIFKIIHLYFLIIVYRNRSDIHMRQDIGSLDTQTLHPVGFYIQKYWGKIQKKYHFTHVREIGIISGLLGVSLLLIASINHFWLSEFIRADAVGAVSSVGSINPIGKVAMDSILLGRVTDGIYSNIQSIGLQNILMVALIAILFQSIRTGFTNLLVNSFFIKIFEFAGTVIKGFSRVVIFLYNYIIYILATRYLFSATQYLLQKSVLPNPYIVSIFLLGYMALYLWVIALYAALIFLVLPWMLPVWQIVGIVCLVASLLIYANISVDIQNFKNFLLYVEKILGGETNSPIENTEPEKKPA